VRADADWRASIRGDPVASWTQVRVEASYLDVGDVGTSVGPQGVDGVRDVSTCLIHIGRVQLARLRETETRPRKNPRRAVVRNKPRVVQ
jgi:hypothetical protein